MAKLFEFNIPLSDFDPNRNFTYLISVNKESFGIYENTVVKLPTS